LVELQPFVDMRDAAIRLEQRSAGNDWNSRGSRVAWILK